MKPTIVKCFKCKGRGHLVDWVFAGQTGYKRCSKCQGSGVIKR